MRAAKVGELCDFASGHGFTAADWKLAGLPIIRIQNLNGSREFNYFQGVPDPEWIVNPGDLLFAWAGVKKVSFGPTVWSGPVGVLNQHIYRVRPCPGIDKRWLFHALMYVTGEIEKFAHGFKTNLVHVRKSDIAGVAVALPDVQEQGAVAGVLDTWGEALRKIDELIVAKEKMKAGFEVRLLRWTREWDASLLRADHLFTPVSEKGRGDLDVLSVTQDRGVIPRRMLDKRILMEPSSTSSFKVVRKGDFVISLRSFEGGLEYSPYDGIVSPAYIVLRPSTDVIPAYFRHYLKSRDFLRRLSIAVIGIRDGKQISFPDFAAIEVPVPCVKRQEAIGVFFDGLANEIELLRRQRHELLKQMTGVAKKLLSGQWRVRSAAVGAAT